MELVTLPAPLLSFLGLAPEQVTLQTLVILGALCGAFVLIVREMARGVDQLAEHVWAPWVLAFGTMLLVASQGFFTMLTLYLLTIGNGIQALSRWNVFLVLFLLFLIGIVVWAFLVLLHALQNVGKTENARAEGVRIGLGR